MSGRSGGGGLACAVAVATFVYVSGTPMSSQSSGSSSLAPGAFLVASRDLQDPNFTETVVVLVHQDDTSWLGLIINRQTKVPLSEAFPNLKRLKGGSDPFYAGGPVSRSGVLALHRSRTSPKEAQRVFGDVSLISTKRLLDKTLAAGTDPGTFRAYLGYSGWTRAQLERELGLGMWHIMRGEADLVFDAEPDSVWRRLIQRTEVRIALRSKPPLWPFAGSIEQFFSLANIRLPAAGG